MARGYKGRWVAALAIVGVGSGCLLWWSDRGEFADTRFSGAYTSADGTLVVIAPDSGRSLRYRLSNGETGVVWPTGPTNFAGGSGWEEAQPITNTMDFVSGAQGSSPHIQWRRPSGETTLLQRLALSEQIFEFPSGSVTLRGKLIKPIGDGPFPAIVIVHGSERTSAVNYYTEPYFYAANGFATLVFDKRGTGESGGEYLQNFNVLADDVRAAIAWLRDRDEVDDNRINLVGFSQGGWIAPLVAARDGRIRSMVVGFGPLVSIQEEDRWGYVSVLQEHGFDADAVAAADRINEILWDMQSHSRNRWDELAVRLDDVRDLPWAQEIKGSDSALGRMLGTDEPMWKSRLIYWWRVGRYSDPPFILWDYDPEPVVSSLKIPSLWFFGAKDSSVPTEWTIRKIEALKAQGKPLETRSFVDAEHGMIRIQEKNGQRHRIGYDPEYLQFHIAWLRRQNAVDR